MAPKKDVISIINESGNSFQFQVVNYLRKKNWAVLISPYYNDHLTSKPREIDIIAEKSYPILSDWPEKEFGTLNIKLFIECKYLNNSGVFWFDNKDLIRAFEIVNYNNDNLFERNPVDLKSFHHYLSYEPVAKLFSADAKKMPENDTIYKAINQSLNAMIYHRYGDSIIPKIGNKHTNILLTVNYPIILFNNFGLLYRVETSGGKNKPVNISNNFLLEINYAYLNKQRNDVDEYFLIDIINFNNIDNYLDYLENLEVNQIKDKLAIKKRTETERGCVNIKDGIKSIN
jgi:hypothetical protein